MHVFYRKFNIFEYSRLQTPVAELMAKQSENCEELELSARERNRAKRKARLLAKNNSKEDSKSANG